MAHAVGRAADPVRDPQADRDHEPAAPRGQGAGAEAGDPDRGPARRARPTAPATRRSAPAGPAPGRGTGQDRVGGRLRRPGLAAQAVARAGGPLARGPRAAPGGARRRCVAQRPEVIRRIATAREHGDLKENAEYHAAREEQGFLEGRIKSIEAKLKVAVVVAPTVRGAIVELGSKVRISEDGEETVMHVVSSAEANSREGRISSVSPVGAALMGRKVGDAVTIVTPGRPDPLRDPRDLLAAASVGAARARARRRVPAPPPPKKLRTTSSTPRPISA